MYIPFWFIFLIIIVIIYLYFKSRKKKDIYETSDLTIEEMWNRAKNYMDTVLENSPILGDYLQDEKDMVIAMEKDMIRLNERQKFNEDKKYEIARDWMDYSYAVTNIKLAKELIQVATEENDYIINDKLLLTSYLTIKEIALRVQKELGENAYSKIVHDKNIA